MKTRFKQISFILSAFNLFYYMAYSQQAIENLVPNPSFENHSCCPVDFGIGPLPCVNNWTNVTNETSSPDYFNSCNNNSVGVPSNDVGFQAAHNGNAYCGIIARDLYLLPDIYSEYLQVQLTRPLVAGLQYRVSMYVNLADNSHYAVTGLSMLLTQNQISGLGNHNMINPGIQPQVNSLDQYGMYGLLSDKTNWVQIYNTFYAQGGENFLTIGVFDQSISQPVSLNAGQFSYAYYYIDDVKVEELPICDHPCLPTANGAVVLDPDPDDGPLGCIPNADPMSIEITNALGYELVIWNSFGDDFYHFTEFNPNGFPSPWFVNWNGEDDNGNGVQQDDYNAFLTVWNCNYSHTYNFTVTSTGFSGQPVHLPPVTDVPYAAGVICCEDHKYFQNYIFPGGYYSRTEVLDFIIAGSNVTTGTTGPVIVENDADVYFVAGNTISLQPGFTVEPGANFHAHLGYCGSFWRYFPPIQPEYPNFEDKEYLRSDYLKVLYSNDKNLRFNFGIDNRTVVNLYIKDIYGHIVKKLKDGEKIDTGNFSINLNITNFSTGTYICILETDKILRAEKFVIIK